MSKYSRKKQLRYSWLSEDVIAIILVVVFLIGLGFYVYTGIKGYDELEIRYMVTTDDERDDEAAGEPITPSVEERMEYALRDYPITMAFTIVMFLLLSLWNHFKGASMQAGLCALYMLLGIGCSQKVLYQGFYGLTGEAGFIMIGCGAMIAMFLLWRWMQQRLNNVMYVILSGLIIVMLGLNMYVILKGLKTNESYNWIRLFGITLQPSVFVKGGLVVLGSCSFSSRRRQVWYFLLLLVSCAVIAAARDIGALFVLALLFVSMVYLILDNRRLMTVVLILGVIAFGVLVLTSSTARERMTNWGDAMTIKRYHQRDFISAVVRAGWKGLGIENASEFFWLYAGDTDGVMAGIQAIFGLPMLLIVIGCYVTLVMQCGVNRSLHRSSQPILFQMGVYITAQVLLNYGGALDVLPFTGITSPFLSTGGSSTVVDMALMGVMLASLYTKTDIYDHKEDDSDEK